MLPSQQEQPIYVIKKDKKRAIVPKTFLLFVLGFIFYLGILLNVSLLELSGQEETTIKIIALVIVVIIIIAGIIMAIAKAKGQYKIYGSKITLKKKQITLYSIENTKGKQNILDKIFKTYSITLNKSLTIKHVSQNNYQQQQVENYLNQLTQYAQTNNQRINTQTIN